MTSREIRLPARYALVVEAAIDRVVRDLARQESEWAWLESERPGGEEVVIRLSVERGRAARRTA